MHAFVVSVCFVFINSLHSVSLELVTRRRNCSFVEYWKHIVAPLNDVHEFDYNSAGSDRIWMKFVALRAYCLELVLTDFGRDPRKATAGARADFFCFFFVR